MFRKLFARLVKFRARDDGATAVEFAFVSVGFMIFVVGIYAAGLYFLTWNRLQYGTEVAARYAAVHDNTPVADLEAMIIDSMSIVSADPANLAISIADSTVNSRNFRTFTTTYQLSWNLPFLPAVMNSLTLQATVLTPVT